LQARQVELIELLDTTKNETGNHKMAAETALIAT